jgi:hypothetical protein
VGFDLTRDDFKDCMVFGFAFRLPFLRYFVDQVLKFPHERQAPEANSRRPQLSYAQKYADS